MNNLPDIDACQASTIRTHTLVIGSGAAGLSAALNLKRRGIEDVLVVTEGLSAGTSINTGSDKQTYYKLSLSGGEGDSPVAMAQTYFEGGSMHGDLALVEASLSARCFLGLADLGVAFPRDRYGQFVGYKTDHDPRTRATSVGPYTSREMCRALISEIERLGVNVMENRVVFQLLTVNQDGGSRAAGAVAFRNERETGLSIEVYLAENVVFATGGPGGLYATSVYPEIHTGGIGLAMLAGARARNLPESQFGLASTGFRWNVSGTYMQSIPRFISTGADGESGPDEFLSPYFEDAGARDSMVFLKGYQWPFDCRKAIGGSSVIDLLVYIEREVKGRRVFLDFRENPAGFDFKRLSSEASGYLRNSEALQETPFERLSGMNPGAVELYREHGIDLASSPLEIAVCAQHNNGGLAGNEWWESENLMHLFPVGEVNGSHGVCRPGGSALNAGQAGGMRCAEYIAHRCVERSLDISAAKSVADECVMEMKAWLGECRNADNDWENEREEFQLRMTRNAAHIRNVEQLSSAVTEAVAQWERIRDCGCRFDDTAGIIEAARNRHLCFAHLVYLKSIACAVSSGVGSRGSAMVLDPRGVHIHRKLDTDWACVEEDVSFREKVLETDPDESGGVSRWVDRRPIPETDLWFETAWAAFREEKIYNPTSEYRIIPSRGR